MGASAVPYLVTAFPIGFIDIVVSRNAALIPALVRFAAAGLRFPPVGVALRHDPKQPNEQEKQRQPKNGHDGNACDERAG